MVLYLLHDVETFHHFAEDGVFAVQMGGATEGGIERNLLGGESFTLGMLHLHLFNEILHLTRGESSAPNDIELGTTAALLWVRPVVLARCCKGSPLVVYATAEFGFKGIAGTTDTESLTCRSILGIGVAALNHESLDDPMEERPVVIALANEFQEVVTVYGRLVIEAYHYVAHRGMDFHTLCLYSHGDKEQQAYDKVSVFRHDRCKVNEFFGKHKEKRREKVWRFARFFVISPTEKRSMMRMIKKIAPFIGLALMAAGCQESLEDRCEREAKEYTEKHCPTPVAKDVVMDSMTFDKMTHTITYAYTLSGQLDDTAVVKGAKSRELLLQEIKNSANLRLYKEAGYSFRYVYHSGKKKGTQLFDATFREADYR